MTTNTLDDCPYFLLYVDMFSVSYVFGGIFCFNLCLTKMIFYLIPDNLYKIYIYTYIYQIYIKSVNYDSYFQ